MRKSVIGAAAVGALAVTAVLGSSAFAHPVGYEVSVNGSTAADTHLFYANDLGGIDFQVKNPAGVITDMDCGSVNAEGEVYSGPSGVDPIAVIKPVSRMNTPEPIDGTEWKSCTGPFGLAMGVNQLNEWEVHATGLPVTALQNDTVEGYISGPGNTSLRAQVYALSGGKTGESCNFIVEGQARGEFDEASQTLRVDEHDHTGFLTVVEVYNNKADCGGLVTVGSTADFLGEFKLGADDSANTKGNITELLDVNLISGS